MNGAKILLFPVEVDLKARKVIVYMPSDTHPIGKQNVNTEVVFLSNPEYYLKAGLALYGKENI